MSSKIEWTGETLNPIVGCTKVSAGCENCYALRMVIRLAHNPKLPPETREKYRSTIHKVDGKWEWSGTLAFFPERLAKPLSWRKPKMVFVCSMSDLFHENVKDEWLAQIFDVIGTCDSMQRGHIFQILTKRPEIMRERLARLSGWTQPFRNVWLGTTVENQEQADKRIPELLQIPAAVRFVSVEPMLGAVDLEGERLCVDCGLPFGNSGEDENGYNASCVNCGENIFSYQKDYLCHGGLDWVICGGESGHGARPMHPDWARVLRDQCTAAGVPFFFKQWGEWAPGRCMREHPVSCWRYGKGHFAEWSGDDSSIDIPDHWMFHSVRTVLTCVAKVGKKKAGRLLDGKLWDEMPNAQAGGEE